MGLADSLDARAGYIRVDDVLAQLDAKDRAAFERALTERSGRVFRWSALRLVEQLEQEGYRVSRYHLQEWRRTRCL